MSRVLVINSPVQSCCGLPKNSCKCFKATKLRWQELPINNVFDPNQPRDTNTGRWVKSGSVHSVLREFDLGDDQNVLIATDALRDAGFDREAEALGKLLGTGMYKELNIKEFSRKHAIAHQVAEAIEDKEELWTRKRANNEKGYNARKAKELLDRNPDTELVVISDSAPTHQGLLIIKRPGGPDKAVLYYRKSSGGKYGRSSQLVYVRPNNPLTNSSGENCGTGAGGFKRGNTCAAGGMVRGWEDSAAGLAKALSLPGARYDDTWKEVVASLNRKPLEQQARVVKTALRLGFTEHPTASQRNWAVYEHPEGHTLILRRSNADRIVAVVRWVAPEYREGFAVSREALRANLATPLPEGHSISAVREAKSGTARAVSFHEDAALYHESRARYTQDKEVSRLHRDAAAANRIAMDYHKERLGLG